MDTDMDPDTNTDPITGANKKQHELKILVVGDPGCGKTASVNRYIHGVYNENYKATLGSDFLCKKLSIDEVKDKCNITVNKPVYLYLWDIAGQDRFSNVTRVYYRDAHAAIIVFDLTRKTTYENMKKWADDIRQIVTYNIPIFIFANKRDLWTNESVAAKFGEIMDTYCRDHRIIKWWYISAKDNTNIDAGMCKVVNTIFTNNVMNVASPPTHSAHSIKLMNIRSNTTQPEKRCCFF